METNMKQHTCLIAIVVSLACFTTVARADGVINLLTDCSHDYSFNLSNASRTQKDIFRGVNCLTSGRTIHKLDLEPINALVVLIDGKLPYLPEDAPYLREYVREGGGLYLGIKTGGVYADDILGFLAGLGLKDAGPRLARDPANFGISAHAPSELVFKLNGEHTRFTSRVGPWADSGGSVAFEVYGDGERLYQGNVLRRGARETIDVSIQGVKELRLVATDGGNGKSADGSIWFDPRVVSASGESERLLLKDATSVKVGWSRATQDRHFNGQPLGAVRSRDAAGADNSIVAATHPGAVPEAKWAAPGSLPNIQPSNKPGWETIYQLSDGSPVVMARQYGKGMIIADTTGLYHAAIGEKEPSRAAMRKLIEYMSTGKQVAAIKGGGGWQFSDGYRWDLISTTKDGLRVHHNEYTKMYVQNDIRAYRQTVEYLTEITGLDEKQKAAQIKELKDRKGSRDNPNNVNYIPDGVLFQIKYLACVGSGFLLPQGSAVDIPPALKDDWQVHLGMFSHEMGHAWSYPFCEKIGEEASAFIFNNLILHRHNGQKHGDSVTRRLMNYLKADGLDDIDLVKNANNSKYYMFIDLMIREYGEESWRNYNLLKYALLNKEGARWDAHSTAWLWSVAIGKDAFPYFQTAFGSSVDRNKVQLPAKAMDAGFDLVTVGRLYDIPLVRPRQLRSIFSTLKDFKDVRAFYAREWKEKGRPDVEG